MWERKGTRLTKTILKRKYSEKNQSTQFFGHFIFFIEGYLICRILWFSVIHQESVIAVYPILRHYIAIIVKVR